VSHPLIERIEPNLNEHILVYYLSLRAKRANTNTVAFSFVLLQIHRFGLVGHIISPSFHPLPDGTNQTKNKIHRFKACARIISRVSFVHCGAIIEPPKTCAFNSGSAMCTVVICVSNQTYNNQ